ncbi:DUF294 nucleotidyltransferase-like domain-containing protein [Marinoscillum furvescens]|uniref:CBS domain-containing protein n=1 Tax=Marinoscillum furvescens DSM 4134 TaxID=1122208 RepID=A0A3D9L2U5_MARFU|nr:DUF294 nucleotidyltransferase-like domain-containing protein [Marinoscillum furvescens]RED96971.1 CBS domain-containing protein [Marinoscillum furvescens DSM 4134]
MAAKLEKRTFLKQVAPFKDLPDEQMELVVTDLKEVRFDKSEVMFLQHKTRVEGLDILVEGGYETFFYTSAGQKQAYNKLKPGETYGAFSILLNKHKSICSVATQKNTRIYRLSSELFRTLCKQQDDFYQYFLSSFGKQMLDDKFANYVANPPLDVESLSFDRYFVRRMDSVNPRPIVSCPADAPAHELAKMMEEHKLSCIFVEEGDDLTGYVTDIILRNKIIAEQRPVSTPARDIMEGPIYQIDTGAYIYEAVLLMFQHKIRYIIVTQGSERLGVVNRSKLLSDQAQSPFVFIQSVRQALTVDELRQKWLQVPEVVHQLLSRGVKSELVNQVITNVSDSIAQKVIEGVIAEIGEPPARFAFMSLGSEGRKEQTLKTDQDNAIIYEDKANEFREKTRKYFLYFAELVSERLNTIGFSFCTGGLMAKNPKWTHSLSHWKRNYNQWIENPDPQSVMNFSTFFDCRLLYGEEKLIEELQAHIVEKLSDPGDLFFSLLANNALQYEPPLTFFRGIRTISKDNQQVFNIKRAMTPIVDLVRVYALKHKILKTNTGERLEALRLHKVLSHSDYHELMQSYYYLMGMRLKYQAENIIDNHEDPHNYVNPKSLTKIEVVTLKEIFKVIANFQQRIKMVFTRNLFG